FRIPEDLPLLELAIGQVKAALVVIDPVMAFLSPQKNSNNDQETRQALTPLAQLAERLDVAVLLVRHLSKDESRQKALYRGGGSIAFIGIARSALVVSKSKKYPNSNALAVAKCNLAPSSPSLLYSIRDSGDSITIEWGVHSAETADELITTGVAPT